MKSLIVYYSYSGNTKKVAEVLTGLLKEKGEVSVVELKALDEARAFLVQCRRALSKVRAKIEPDNFNLSGYDLVCLGTPVWAFAPTPAINTFLDNCAGLGGKEAAVFTTYGSGSGNKRCLAYMQNTLLKKGAKKCEQFSIQQFKVSDKEFITAKIKESLRLWPNG